MRKTPELIGAIVQPLTLTRLDRLTALLLYYLRFPASRKGMNFVLYRIQLVQVQDIPIHSKAITLILHGTTFSAIKIEYINTN